MIAELDIGKNSSPPKKKRKTLWKRDAKPVTKWSLQTKVEDSAQPTLKVTESEFSDLESHEITLVRSSSPTILATTGDWVSCADQDLEEMILSLLALPSSPTQPASHVVRSSLDRAPVEVISVSGTTPVGLKLETSVLRDLTLASELLSKLLLSANAIELLSISRRKIRRGVVDCLIWVCWDFLI